MATHAGTASRIRDAPPVRGEVRKLTGLVAIWWDEAKAKHALKADFDPRAWP